MDDIGWEVDADDESSAIAELIGRQIKFWREAAGLRAVQFGELMGYGENLIHKVERGARIPRPEFLDRADEVLNTGGHLRGLKPDAEKARYPRKVRDVAKLEAQAVEVCSYNNSVVDGLLQHEDYAEAVFSNRRPPLPHNEVERRLLARMDRQQILKDAVGRTVFSFVLCESTLRRNPGGTMTLRNQLEHLSSVSGLRNVDIQVLPLSRERNTGLEGPFRLTKLKDGTTVGLIEVQLASRVVTDPKEVQILDMRYGIIRAQALTPEESQDFIEKMERES
ncbi:helix-turn-helix domain-containing protein [Streptomyces aureocirculatus]|uniref:helix-turn-helix domain-containing protein n=1 Tax=Streptomyces aureocirculatus TaxID=67275 RepID=UPI0004CB77F3|nr:helix-turn-helix transcriptional regulator [Streptomyces aureocirculatus]